MLETLVQSGVILGYMPNTAFKHPPIGYISIRHTFQLMTTVPLY